jgi:hypothetical protein
MHKEIKSTLARLLATENLLVEHRQVPTASFNVETRVLTLPMWTRASDTVYDLLVGHEVGHALYTPNDDSLDNLDCPQSYVNVTEDARIEKLMKRKYPGLGKDFYQGYKELNDDDFFEIADVKLESMSLIDRVNLHYKIGSYAMLPFNATETPLRDAVGVAETFQEAIDAAVAIYKFAKEEQEKQTPPPVMQTPPSASGDTPSQTENKDIQMSDTDSPGEVSRPWFTDDEPDTDKMSEEDNDDAQLDTPSYEYIQPNIDNVQTQRNFDENASGLINTSIGSPTYLSFPKINFKNVIVPNKELWNQAEYYWDSYYDDFPKNPFIEVDDEFRQFCNNTAKDVNYLVKEFECKKSASSYARATTSRTGVLDTTKLHNYRFSEDIFKKVTRTTDGKNHGLVFLLDWSGSMSPEIFDTVCQVINLAQFCKKVGIPFDVYTFVTDATLLQFFGVACDTHTKDLPAVSDSKVGDFYIDPRFKLVNVLTSDGNQSDFKRQCNYMYRVANYWHERRDMYRFRPAPPNFMGLGGTPLNDALIVMRQYLGEWQRNAGVEKSHLVVLTDGESQSTAYMKQTTADNYHSEPYPFYVYDQQITIRTRNRYYSCDRVMTNTLLTVIRDTYPECSVIGFRICSTRALGQYLRVLGMDTNDTYCKTLSRDRSVAIDKSPYTQLYVVQSRSYNADTEMTVSDDATKGQIRSAFRKSLKSKSVNRKMLSAFAGQIA